MEKVASKELSFQCLDGLEALASRYDTFIVDLWGVIHDGHQTFEGVSAALSHLQAQGKTVVFLSNSPRRHFSLEKQLSDLGITRTLYERVYSSGEDAFNALTQEHRGKMCYPLAAAAHADLLDDLGSQVTYDVKEADFLLNTGPYPLVIADHEALLTQCMTLDLPMICVNPDMSVITQGVEILCAGSLAARYKELGGRVSYHGKPFEAIYTRLWEILGKPDKSRMIATGDSLNTDVQGGTHFGIDTILVMSGLEGSALGVRPGDTAPEDRLAARFAQKGITPTFVLPQFNW